ncbi:hypothetical protein H6G36_21635 [Anabaena minutissima FACHB-250]|nr:hypothetical protein [Anabaena minutissima FACHB-250]
MKNNLKKLKDIDFLTKLTLSEQEQINGGNLDLTSDGDGTPGGRSPGFGATPEPPPPEDEDDLYKGTEEGRIFLKTTP